MEAPSSRANPHAEYQQRLDRFRTQAAQLESRLAWLGNTRFVLFVAGVVVFGCTVVWRVASPWWLLLPGGLFLGLSIAFEQASRRNRYARRAVANYEYGLARLEDRWAGGGVTGAEYLDENHLYAADLDLFGRGSLFERLCDAHTRIGRDKLALWLCGSAPAKEVAARQAAVADLRDRLDWREQMALAGAAVPGGIDTTSLAEWGMVPPGKPAPWARLLAPCLAAVTLVTLYRWLEDWLRLTPLLLALLVQGAFAWWLGPRVGQALAGVRGRSRDLLRLTGFLTSIEREPFTAPRLLQLQASLAAEGAPPSKHLARLASRIELLDYTRSGYFAVLAPFLLWTTQVALALQEWRRRTGPALPRWLAVIAEVEALTALASYAYENPEYPFPEVVAEGPLLDAVGLGHPLLPRDRCVVNDVCLNDQRRLLVVSGSNMSGKSTFLRTVGTNTVLALAGAPVRASRLRLSPLAIGATLRIQDSLQAGRSRFYAEITRLRQVVELAAGPLPLLFLLDEILHGTNSHDRRIGTEAILRTLLQRPAIGLVTTHDLALTEIAEQLAPLAANVHFADQMEGNTLHFDYRLHPGVVRHSNALALMRAVGLDVDLDDSGRGDARRS